MNAPQTSLRAQVSEQEWKLRVELAAVYRLVALYGWDDLVFTHISARIPGPEHHFLINPYGLMFEEITASSLVYAHSARTRLAGVALSTALPPQLAGMRERQGWRVLTCRSNASLWTPV